MNGTTPKLGCTFSGIAGAAILILGLALPAAAMESIPPPCHLYSGEASLKSLKQRESHLKDEFLHSASATSGDHCEMANVHYKLARMLPDQQIQYLNSCIDHSQRAILRDSRSGGGYFLKGLCLGRLGELKGIWSSLKIIEPVRENMEAAAKINPALDQGGPHRALGRLYFKLPAILGGDLKKSIDHLLKAVDYGPQYWENHYFLAESYFENRQYLLARSELQRAMDIAPQPNDDPDNKTHEVEFQALMKAIERNLH
ncbi:MAG: TRAP transporter TatT component family protein [Nitrospinota bacterium]|nr:TRAP transporter TatT component family protein [Nitrospinota bacterium]